MQDATEGPEPSAPRDGPVARFHFTTTDATSPFDAWRSLLAVLFESLPPRKPSGGGFQADLAVHHFGTFLLCRSLVEGGRYLRSTARLAWDDLDHIVISCLQRGCVVLASSKARRLLPGDVAIVDLATAVTFAPKAAETIHLILPRTALSPAAVSAQVWPILAKDTAMGTVIGAVLEGLAEAAQRLSPSELIALGSTVPDLISACLTSTVAATSTTVKDDLSRRLRRHIEENLHRKDLTPSRLARDLGVSRSQLYRQFETGGGVETYIRRRRLRRCLLALCDPRHAERRIGDIAFEMGFADEAHFSRLFRRLFGVSPRAARLAARRGEAPAPGAWFPPNAGNSLFGHWLTGLGTR